MSRDPGDVFVEPDGSLTVNSSAAVAKLQSKPGEYSLLPSPPDLILLRRTASLQSSSRVLLAGEITERGTILEILQFITQANWTGEFLVVDGEVHRSILFDTGTVILATSNAPPERLGEILYKHGKLSRAQFDEALRLMGPTRRFGDIVVTKGWIKPNDLFAMLQRQVEEIFYNTLSTARGTFLFARGIDAAAIPVRVNLSAGGLMMEGVQRIDEWAYFRAKIPDAHVVLVPVAGRDAGEIPHGARLLAELDGVRTLEDVARITTLGEFETTKAAFALLQAGVVHARRAATARDGLVAHADGFNEVLRDVHATVDRAGVGNEARDTLSMFLQGGGAFDALFENAGPLADGSFDSDKIVANVGALQTDDPARVVLQAMHDYVAFALFAAGSVLKREEHQSLARRVQEQLTKLRAGQKSS